METRVPGSSGGSCECQVRCMQRHSAPPWCLCSLSPLSVHFLDGILSYPLSQSMHVVCREEGPAVPAGF